MVTRLARRRSPAPAHRRVRAPGRGRASASTPIVMSALARERRTPDLFIPGCGSSGARSPVAMNAPAPELRPPDLFMLERGGRAQDHQSCGRPPAERGAAADASAGETRLVANDFPPPVGAQIPGSRAGCPRREFTPRLESSSSPSHHHGRGGCPIKPLTQLPPSEHPRESSRRRFTLACVGDGGRPAIPSGRRRMKHPSRPTAPASPTPAGIASVLRGPRFRRASSLPPRPGAPFHSR